MVTRETMRFVTAFYAIAVFWKQKENVQDKN